MTAIETLVKLAQSGDLEAYGQLVERTRKATYGAALATLRDPSAAEDATQEAYLRAFRRLRDLHDPAAFPGWLRRTVVTVSLNLRRAQRHTFLRLDDEPEVPVLDETETTWTEQQRLRLSAA